MSMCWLSHLFKLFFKSCLVEASCVLDGAYVMRLRSMIAVMKLVSVGLFLLIRISKMMKTKIVTQSFLWTSHWKVRLRLAPKIDLVFHKIRIYVHLLHLLKVTLNSFHRLVEYLDLMTNMLWCRRSTHTIYVDLWVDICMVYSNPCTTTVKIYWQGGVRRESR